MAGGCGVGAFCSFCGKCGRVFGTVFDDIEVPVVAPPGTTALPTDPEKKSSVPVEKEAENEAEISENPRV